MSQQPASENSVYSLEKALDKMTEVHRMVLEELMKIREGFDEARMAQTELNTNIAQILERVGGDAL